MEAKQNLISFTVFFENFFGYNEKKSMGDLHQLIKHKIFNGNWDEFRSNWSTGLDMYDKIIDGINTYEEGFDRVVKILKELPLPDDSKKSFLELTLEMYHETSPTSGVIESEINDENQINKQHPNYSKFKIFEYLSNALGDDIVLNFLISNKPKTSQSSIDGKHEIHIDDSDFTDITDLIAKGLQHLEKNYDVDFDEIDTWEPDEAYEYVSELLDNNPDDNELKDLQTNLDSISTEDFVLSVEKYSEL